MGTNTYTIQICNIGYLQKFLTSTKNLLIISTRCIIEQYGNYTVEVDGETLNVNGINSQVEYYNVTYDNERGYFHQWKYYDHNHYFFIINETKLDLHFFQGENIADNGGVKEALLAYNRLTEK